MILAAAYIAMGTIAATAGLTVFCKSLSGEDRFSAFIGDYAVTLATLFIGVLLVLYGVAELIPALAEACS